MLAPSPFGEGWGEAANTRFLVLKEAFWFFSLSNLKERSYIGFKECNFITTFPHQLVYHV